MYTSIHYVNEEEEEEKEEKLDLDALQAELEFQYFQLGLFVEH